MLAVCLRYVNDPETARDLMQDGFIKVFTSINTYTGSGAFEGWLRKIFVNCALEYLRRNDVLRESTDLDNTAELVQPNSNAISDLSAAELKEISEALGITESTSRSQYTRAKQLLQKKIKELYE